MNHFHTQKGYTLLFSVLVSSLVLAMGVSILSISRKEIILTSASRESQFAYYAADSGLECVQYWDFVGDGFATSSESGNSIQTVRCGGNDVEVEIVDQSDSSAESLITINNKTDPTQNFCASVSVAKSLGGSSITISSRGYNSCDEDNERRVERAILLTQTILR